MSTPADPSNPERLPATAESQQLEPDDQLKPGAGRPLVEGPPDSVGEPISDRKVNLVAGVSGLVLFGVAGVVALILLVILIVAITGHVR
jgi:hypothetical protein